MVATLLTAVLLYFLPLSASSKNAFSLSYNGGKIMTEPVSVSLLWFGTGWQESGREVIRNAITSVTQSRYPAKNNEVPTLGDWWDIVRQYRDGSDAQVTDKLDIAAECFYTGTEVNVTREQVVEIGGSVFNQTSVDGFGGNLKCSRVFELNDRSIYYVLFSHTVLFLFGKEQMELIDPCSGNLNVSSVGLSVRLLWVRAPQGPYDQCVLRGNHYTGPPNGDKRVDSVVGYMLGKIAEDVTNRDGRGWVSNDGSGLTVKSSCDSPFEKDKDGAPMFTFRNMSFNAVGLNGYRYILPYIWDQKINNCALKLSGTCGADAVLVQQPKGYLSAGIAVNHSNGLQPYPPNQRCQWKLDYPDAKFISFTINYLLLPAESDDHLKICQSDSSHKKCYDFQQDNGDISKNFKLMSSKAYVEFTSGDRVPFVSRGWELSYSAGFCNGKKDVYDHEGVVSYASSTGFSYVKGLSCQWVFHGKPGTPVSLKFSRINISRGLDFVAIYDATLQQIANFSGLYADSDLPRVNLTGQVRIAFATQTEEGEGWSANFHISSPVEREKKVLLVIVIVLVSVIGLSLSLGIIALALRKRRIKHGNTMNSHEGLALMRVVVNREENRIGEGPSAVIYKTVLTDRSWVAVMSLRDSVPASQRDLEQEILLKGSSHPNIVSLAGYAKDMRNGRYLILEFLSGGSLSYNLKERGETLEWGKRLAIALQISSAIQMLHMYLKPAAYHGNVTSENILLDELSNAKLAGFGTANYCRNDQTEMAEDIWGLGILFVELLRGEPLESRSACMKMCSLEEINEFVGRQGRLDPRLDNPKEKNKMMALGKFGDIARWCISSSLSVQGYANKPKIGDVLAGLKQVKKLFASAST